MKAGPDNNPSRDARLDENDPVWRLLGRAPLAEPDGWFATRAMARCREAKRGAESGLVSFMRIWRWALGGGLAVSMAVALTVTQIHAQKAEKQKKVQEAFEILATIDNDSDSSSSPWQDSSL